MRSIGCDLIDGANQIPPQPVQWLRKFDPEHPWRFLWTLACGKVRLRGPVRCEVNATSIRRDYHERLEHKRRLTVLQH